MLQAALLFVSIFVTSIESVFDLVGGVVSPAIAYLFPGVAVLAAAHQLSKKSSKGKDSISNFETYSSCFLIFSFCVAFGLFVFIEIQKAA